MNPEPPSENQMCEHGTELYYGSCAFCDRDLLRDALQRMVKRDTWMGWHYGNHNDCEACADYKNAMDVIEKTLIPPSNNQL